MIKYIAVIGFILIKMVFASGNASSFYFQGCENVNADSFSISPNTKFRNGILGFNSISLSILKSYDFSSTQLLHHWGLGIGTFRNHKQGRTLDFFSGLAFNYRNGKIDRYVHNESYYNGTWNYISREFTNIRFNLYFVQIPFIFRFNLLDDYKISFDLAPLIHFNFITGSGNLVERTFNGSISIRNATKVFLPYRKFQMGLNMGFNRRLVIYHSIILFSFGVQSCIPYLFNEKYSARGDEYIDIEKNGTNSTIYFRICKYFD